MSNENSIIKIDGNISNPATVLIEKISGAIGIVYEPTRIVRKAKAEVEAERIKVLAGIETSKLEQRAMNRMVREESKKQENMEVIAVQAANNLNEKARPEEMDNDWIAYFFEKCRVVSDKQMQQLWSNILSGEANSPGTCSKRTLALVALLEPKEAHLFTMLSSFIISYKNNILNSLILNLQDEIYSKVGLNDLSLIQLEEIGVVKFDRMEGGYITHNMPKEAIADYYGTKFKFEFKKNSNNTLPIGRAVLTKSGRQLALICGSKMNPEFIGYAMEYYNKKNKDSDVVSMAIVE